MNIWERSKGITQQMKRSSKIDRTLIPSRISQRVKDRFIFDTMQQWLWNYNNFSVFREANYSRQIMPPKVVKHKVKRTSYIIEFKREYDQMLGPNERELLDNRNKWQKKQNWFWSIS
uniref:Uncharacterized protein n=1 Tax=Rhizophagus irregularis (strain DAOM 181602 / DAOM 197198 / MUCL 43194) TaxID=747089 RepID=U9SI39_RHIID